MSCRGPRMKNHQASPFSPGKTLASLESCTETRVQHTVLSTFNTGSTGVSSLGEKAERRGRRNSDTCAVQKKANHLAFGVVLQHRVSHGRREMQLQHWIAPLSLSGAISVQTGEQYPAARVPSLFDSSAQQNARSRCGGKK